MQNNTLGLVLLCLELLSFGQMLKFDFVKKLLAKQGKKILASDWPVSFVMSLEGKQIQFFNQQPRLHHLLMIALPWLSFRKINGQFCMAPECSNRVTKSINYMVFFVGEIYSWQLAQNRCLKLLFVISVTNNVKS